ncbi:capsular biosynthesis protein [Pseudomonas kermanshahensis]|uniref:capsular biosynthesis protein n=1 Tax=Pseudomonas TaxID=286 RepID=UPI000A168C0C|nr:MULTISPECIES: capsular biosynthesis protein [Pseudomonas]MBC3486192.1 capsular biosynthesis protein [Pseudomonas sp. SWRI50]WEL56901.1 capsular biosynthesis protein [Pseudomonas kermanshahensis]SMR79592.1 Predicted glycosyltransferase involved in capsule biosynthesis [Pseudomonas sp. LAIL14HWK12:I10]SOD05663.1 Predicted glycosyltransferase involved in capsule biosynthesis [Pseudomonas sp. LAIL14HWK12:I8]
MNDISIIVPLDLSQRPLDILRKAVRMSDAAESARIPLIFSLNDQNSLNDRRLKKSLENNRYTTLLAKKHYTGSVNPSLLRNRAFEVVNTELIALLDVDIWPDFSLLEKYRDLIAAKHSPFYFLPCMYLTAKGSKDLCKGKTTPALLKEKYFSFSRKEFLHLANPSSVTLMKSDDYAAIGQFNESYSGHGYEDFDFMMRLAQHYGSLQPCREMMSNKSARSPLFTSGFRRALGRLSLDALLNKDFVFHLYHERPNVIAHKERRESNYSRFVETHNRNWGDDISKSLLEEFIEACRLSDRSVDDYSALFENKPGHIDRFDTFKRRLRFLLNE